MNEVNKSKMYSYKPPKDDSRLKCIKIDSSLVFKEDNKPKVNIEGILGALPLTSAIKEIGTDYFNEMKKYKHVPDNTQEIEMLNIFDALYIPDKELCQIYIDSFFTYAHYHFPTINRTVFERDFSDFERPSHLFTFQAIVAVGARFLTRTEWTTEEINRQHDIVNLLVKRAKVLYEVNTPIEVIPMLQSLLLLAFLWEEDGLGYKNGLYWTQCAANFSQNYALHKSVENRNLSVYEKKSYKRIFWTIYIRDRLTAMSVGRPFLINLSECSVEPLTMEDLNDDIPDLPSKYPQNQLSSYYFIHLIKFAHLLTNVIHKSSSASVNDSSLSDGGILLNKHDTIRSDFYIKQCDILCSKWFNDLPYGLKFTDKDKNTQNQYSALLCSQYYSLLASIHKSNIISRSMASTKGVSNVKYKDEYFPSWGITFQSGYMIAKIGEFLYNSNDIVLVAPVYCFCYYIGGLSMIYHLKNKDKRITAIANSCTSTCIKCLNKLSITLRPAKIILFILLSVYNDDKKIESLVTNVLQPIGGEDSKNKKLEENEKSERVKAHQGSEKSKLSSEMDVDQNQDTADNKNSKVKIKRSNSSVNTALNMSLAASSTKSPKLSDNSSPASQSDTVSINSTNKKSTSREKTSPGSSAGNNSIKQKQQKKMSTDNKPTSKNQKLANDSKPSLSKQQKVVKPTKQQKLKTAKEQALNVEEDSVSPSYSFTGIQQSSNNKYPQGISPSQKLGPDLSMIDNSPKSVPDSTGAHNNANIESQQFNSGQNEYRPQSFVQEQFQLLQKFQNSDELNMNSNAIHQQLLAQNQSQMQLHQLQQLQQQQQQQQQMLQQQQYMQLPPNELANIHHFQQMIQQQQIHQLQLQVEQQQAQQAQPAHTMSNSQNSPMSQTSNIPQSQSPPVIQQSKDAQLIEAETQKLLLQQQRLQQQQWQALAFQNQQQISNNLFPQGEFNDIHRGNPSILDPSRSYSQQMMDNQKTFQDMISEMEAESKDNTNFSQPNQRLLTVESTANSNFDGTSSAIGGQDEIDNKQPAGSNMYNITYGMKAMVADGSNNVEVDSGNQSANKLNTGVPDWQQQAQAYNNGEELNSSFFVDSSLMVGDHTLTAEQQLQKAIALSQIQQQKQQQQIQQIQQHQQQQHQQQQQQQINYLDYQQGIYNQMHTVQGDVNNSNFNTMGVAGLQNLMNQQQRMQILQMQAAAAAAASGSDGGNFNQNAMFDPNSQMNSINQGNMNQQNVLFEQQQQQQQHQDAQMNMMQMPGDMDINNNEQQ